ncbi:MAG: serine hydrolase [Candidatus Bathyarchaeota archaeon]|nr:serine hydrolase [Candidatus Bathyarchaeota archaeon]
MSASKGVEKAREFAERIIPEFMREGKVPGFSVAVVKEGEVVYAQGFGSRDPARSLPATPETLYGIGSCTKSFVALAAMQLVEKGKIKLSDPASEYVPFRLGVEGKPITIHHLLTHGSGLPNLGTSTIGLSRGVGVDLGVPWGSVDDFYRVVNSANSEIAADPGERFFYSNEGFRVVGHIIQEVSGVPFHEYVQENILKPLGMRRSTLVKHEFDADPDRMVAHWKKTDGTLQPTGFPYPDVSENPGFSWNAAAGGLMAPMTELTTYLATIMEGGVHKGKRLVKAESVEKMFTPHIKYTETYWGTSSYGYGWSVLRDFLGHRQVSHGGSLLVATAHLAMVPDLKLGVAMAANTSRPPFATIADGIFAALMGKDPYSHPHLRLREKMRSLTGEYQTHMGLEKLRVISRGGLLYLEQRDHFVDATTPLIPSEPMLDSLLFYTITEGIRQPIEFVKTEKGYDLFVERYRYHKRLE